MAIEGVALTDGFVEDSAALFRRLRDATDWDGSMAARATASFGAAYNYSQMRYPDRPMPAELAALCRAIAPRLGFLPNNCLLNFYPDGQSRMGFHSDQTDILVPGTGVAIVSLGATRTLRFRRIDAVAERVDFALRCGSLLYMTAAVQAQWQHAIPRSAGAGERISLTFRALLHAGSAAGG